MKKYIGDEIWKGNINLGELPMSDGVRNRPTFVFGLINNQGSKPQNFLSKFLIFFLFYNIKAFRKIFDIFLELK